MLPLIPIILVYAILLFLAPFPLWRSFCAVAYNLAINHDLPIKKRLRLFRHIILELIISPVFTIAFFIDDIVYRKYKYFEISAPVFIVGQPRNGTTFLHRTLSMGDEFFSLKHFEWRFPAICLWRLMDVLGLRSTIEAISYWPKNPDGENAQKMHKNCLGDFEEHGIFFEERFYHHYFLLRRYPFNELFPLISSFKKLSDKQKQKMLRVFASTVKKAMFYNKTSRLWLTKENESIELYEMMAEVFPDARYIFIVRTSDHFMKSYVNLSITSTMAKTGINPMDIDGWNESNIEFRRNECIKMLPFYKKVTNTNTAVAITYENLMSDIPNTVGFIYKKLGLSITDEYKKKLYELQHSQARRDSGYRNENRSFTGFEFFDSFVKDIDRQYQQEFSTHIEMHEGQGH